MTPGRIQWNATYYLNRNNAEHQHTWISLISAEWIPALSLWSSAIPLSLHVWDVPKSSRVEQQRRGKVGRDADSEEERKGKVLREQRERKADRELVIEVWCVRLWASVSCRGLQMALRIKSKLCWLPRNGLCDTSSATWGGERGGEGGNTGAEGRGWRRGLQPYTENRLQMSFWNI